MKKNLLELERNISELMKHCDYDDIEYRGIRDVKNLFDYYKPTRTTSAFNGNYIEYESKGDKDKTSPII